MSRSYRNRNPGNIRWGTWAQSHGAIANDGSNYAVFPSPIVGLAALVDLLANNYGSKTIAEAMKVYAPAEDSNDPRSYAAYVAKQAGVMVTAVLKDLDPFQLLSVVKAIVSYEGWKAE